MLSNAFEVKEAMIYIAILFYLVWYRNFRYSEFKIKL